MPRGLSLLPLLLLSAPAAFAAEPWHLPDWTARAVVEIAAPSTEEGVDAAGVKVLCQGRARPDGADYRVLDAAGKPVPFQIDFHDADHYSLLTFKCDNPRQRYFVYFGNPKAARAAEQSPDPGPPGAGAPKGAWIPQSDFVFQTVERPRADDIAKEQDPKTVEEMTKLIAGSKGKEGARWQRHVADGYNPFGSSEYYISIYRGWIRIPKAGKYQFCTVSKEASFSFLDGKELIHWPGRHTTERGQHGEVNATVDLTAGLHYLEYYHEAVTLEQMAYLGWRPSADKGAFSPIPETVYTAPHAAAVSRYEDPKGPLLCFEPAVADSVWPAERHEGQYTHFHFQVAKASALPEGTKYQWDFGDGQTTAGPEADHVYLTLGPHKTTLTAGPLTAAWPLQVFELQHVTDLFKEGKPKDYAQTAKGYDKTKLSADALRELAYLFAEGDQPAEAVEAAKAFDQRFPKAPPLDLARMRRLSADCTLRIGKDGIDEAVKSYQASLVKEMPAAEKIDVLARLIRLLGVEREQPEKAVPILAQVDEVIKTEKVDDEVQAAYRRAVIALGDVYLWQGKLDSAREQYKRAERLSGEIIPANVRSARLGAYPDSLHEYLTAGDTGAALDLIDRWEQNFPTDKPNGHSLYWRGKVVLLRGRPEEAARCLNLSVRLTTGADFEPEARWLLAEALDQLGRKDDARKELAKLAVLGLDDPFVKKAKEKLKN